MKRSRLIIIFAVLVVLVSSIVAVFFLRSCNSSAYALESTITIKGDFSNLGFDQDDVGNFYTMSSEKIWDSQKLDKKVTVATKYSSDGASKTDLTLSDEALNILRAIELPEQYDREFNRGTTPITLKPIGWTVNRIGGITFAALYNDDDHEDPEYGNSYRQVIVFESRGTDAFSILTQIELSVDESTPSSYEDFGPLSTADIVQLKSNYYLLSYSADVGIISVAPDGSVVDTSVPRISLSKYFLAPGFKIELGDRAFNNGWDDVADIETMYVLSQENGSIYKVGVGIDSRFAGPNGLIIQPGATFESTAPVAMTHYCCENVELEREWKIQGDTEFPIDIKAEDKFFYTYYRNNEINYKGESRIISGERNYIKKYSSDGELLSEVTNDTLKKTYGKTLLANYIVRDEKIITFGVKKSQLVIATYSQ